MKKGPDRPKKDADKEPARTGRKEDGAHTNDTTTAGSEMERRKDERVQRIDVEQWDNGSKRKKKRELNRKK